MHLQNHVRIHHQKIDFYACKYCDQSFRYYNGRNIHHHACHSEELLREGIQPFLCSICSLKFNSKFQLNAHHRLHQFNQLYCKICPNLKDFTTVYRRELHIHIREAHPEYHINGELKCIKKEK